MAKAFECDRCGTLYSDEDNKMPGIFVGKRDEYYCFKTLDLCPVCQKRFEAWFDAGKQEGDENG